MFDCTPVFYENYYCNEKIVVNQGGTGSSKTYSILQVLFDKAVRNSVVITIAGQDIPNLKKGAYRDAETIINKSPRLNDYILSQNKTDRIIYFKNGSIMEFNSYSDAQDAKSGKRDYLFINEANGISYEVYWQLYIRTRKQIFIDYNPSAQFYVHEKLLGTSGVKLIISDHRHNVFLSPDEHKKIESIDDYELWKVYARGKTGKLEGLIFTNWTLCDHMPATDKQSWGMDFGYVHDATTIINTRINNGELYINELLYRTGMTNPEIADFIKQEELTRKGIIADSAEPKSIEEISRQGIDIRGATKGPGSVMFNIDLMKRYPKIHITKRSLNTIKEFRNYQWRKDKNGVSMNQPVDYMDHAIQAAMYSLQRFQVPTARPRVTMI